jgi:hypothetical protein
MLGRLSSGRTSSEATERGDLRADRRPNPPIDVRLCRERAFREATNCVTRNGTHSFRVSLNVS